MAGQHELNGKANGVSGHDSVTPLDVAPDLSLDSPLDLDRVYSGSRFLLLGGTGFLGKIFWVLLLDRFPDIEKIFLVVRSSKGKTTQERFNDILLSDAVRPLRDKYGESFEAFVRSKVVPIDGEMSRPLCGVDPALATELAGTLDA